ncbi:MAG TPA: TonB family protein [Gemmatimonadales bacterium]
MHGLLLESRRSLLQTTECALASLFAHGMLVSVAVGLSAGGRQLPSDEREARAFFLLPPDRVVERNYQTEIFQRGVLGIDLHDGADLTHPDVGPEWRPQARGARGEEKGSGARGAVPFGPPARLPLDSIFSVLQVDQTVERYAWSAAPEYPEELAALGTQGVVRAFYVVDTTGTVDTTSVQVVYSDDPHFTRSVVTALGRMRFRPATKSGRTVRQLVEQQFRFRIRPLIGLAPSTPS